MVFGLIAALALVPATAYLQTDSNANTNVAPALPPAPVAPEDLTAQIQERKARVDDLQKRIDAYEKNFQAATEQRTTLQGELSALSGQIEDVELRLDQSIAAVELTELQVSQVEADIATKENERDVTLNHLGAIVRDIHARDQVSPLAATLTAGSISEIFRSFDAASEIYGQLRENLDALQKVQTDLTLNRSQLSGQLAVLDEVRDRQRTYRDTLDQQQTYKGALLNRTRQSETKLSGLIASVRDEAASINAEITTLEEKARGSVGDGSLGTGHLRWPVDPLKGISAYFHDPTYPFRCTVQNPKNCIGEHNAVDIPTAQGTPVKAADDGYVAIARKIDWVRNEAGQILYPAYNYIVLLHTNGLATVYGHLSQVLVNQDTYVKQGDVIARSGATPGTAGAGRWTTGAHLHFEVRVNGIPDDPTKYLP